MRTISSTQGIRRQQRASIAIGALTLISFASPGRPETILPGVNSHVDASFPACVAAEDKAARKSRFSDVRSISLAVNGQVTIDIPTHAPHPSDRQQEGERDGLHPYCDNQ